MMTASSRSGTFFFCLFFMLMRRQPHPSAMDVGVVYWAVVTTHVPFHHDTYKADPAEYAYRRFAPAAHQLPLTARHDASTS